MQALESYTIHPAAVSGRSRPLGHLAPGCHADLIVLPVDPFKIDPSDLYQLKPDMVMVAGEWVFGG